MDGSTSVNGAIRSWVTKLRYDKVLTYTVIMVYNSLGTGLEVKQRNGGEKVVQEVIKHYTVRQTSELLGIKVRTVRDWISKGKIRAVKYDGSNRWFISHKEIQRILEGHEHDN